MHNIVRTTLALALVLLGSALTGCGVTGYLSLNPTDYGRPTSRFGFVVFSSWYVDTRTANAAVDMRVYDINIVSKSATVSVYLQFRTSDNVSQTILFAFQIPYNFTELSVWVDMQNSKSGQGQGGGFGNSFFLNKSSGLDTETGLYYFWTMVNRTKSGKYFDSISLNATMILNSVLFRKSYSTYELQSQFDAAPETPIRNQVPGKMISFFTPFNSGHYLLSVAQPRNSQIQSNPAADQLRFSTGETWYIWDMVRRSSTGDFFATGVQTDFEIVDLVRTRENTIFVSSLFLGVGLPTMISGVVELVKIPLEEQHDRGLVRSIIEKLRKREQREKASKRPNASSKASRK
jgi:predicted small lipoprotein YifL